MMAAEEPYDAPQRIPFTTDDAPTTSSTRVPFTKAENGAAPAFTSTTRIPLTKDMDHVSALTSTKQSIMRTLTMKRPGHCYADCTPLGKYNDASGASSMPDTRFMPKMPAIDVVAARPTADIERYKLNLVWEIKCQAPRAIDATFSLQPRLLDGVAVLRHRRGSRRPPQ